MSKRIQIPTHAETISAKQGTINSGPEQGQFARLSIHRAYLSQGYKSAYEKIETIFTRIEIHRKSGKTTIDKFSRTGKNIPIAFDDYNQTSQLITQE